MNIATAGMQLTSQINVVCLLAFRKPISTVNFQWLHILLAWLRKQIPFLPSLQCTITHCI